MTVFTKNRDRLLRAEVAKIFFAEVLAQARDRELLSAEHFAVDGALIEASASHKSFKRTDGSDQQRPDDPGNPTVDFHGEAQQRHPPVDHRRRRATGAQKAGQGSQAQLRRAHIDGEPQLHRD